MEGNQEYTAYHMLPFENITTILEVTSSWFTAMCVEHSDCVADLPSYVNAFRLFPVFYKNKTSCPRCLLVLKVCVFCVAS